MKNYLTDYYSLLDAFYNINKLKINAKKTLLLLVFKPKHYENLKYFFFFANNHKIWKSNTIIILGQYLRSDLKMDSQIVKMCSALHNKMFNLKKVKKLQLLKLY